MKPVIVMLVAGLVGFGSDAAAQSTTAPSAVVAAAPFPADARIAYVDAVRVATLSAEGKAAHAKLNALRTKISAALDARGKEVKALQDKLSQGETLLNDAARARLQREFQRAQVDFQRSSEDARAEFQSAQQETFGAFTAQLFSVVRELATEKKLWAVFGPESGLMWHDPSTDLSAEVAKRLDAAAARR